MAKTKSVKKPKNVIKNITLKNKKNTKISNYIENRDQVTQTENNKIMSISDIELQYGVYLLLYLKNSI
jgi:hypothetical protein